MAHAALKVMVTTPEPNEKKLASLANSLGADKFSAVGMSGGCALVSAMVVTPNGRGLMYRFPRMGQPSRMCLYPVRALNACLAA